MEQETLQIVFRMMRELEVCKSLQDVESVCKNGLFEAELAQREASGLFAPADEPVPSVDQE